MQFVRVYTTQRSGMFMSKRPRLTAGHSSRTFLIAAANDKQRCGKQEAFNMRTVPSLARSHFVATLALCILSLAGCGGGGGGGGGDDGGGGPQPPPPNPPATTHRIGGTVSGLGGTGLILQ